MDADRFDTLSRALTTSRSRRATLGALLGTLLGSALPGWLPEARAAGKETKKRKTTRQGRGHRQHDRQTRDGAPTDLSKDRKKRATRKTPSQDPTAEQTPKPVDEAARAESREDAGDAVNVASHGCGHAGARCRRGSQCCTGKCIRKRKCSCDANNSCPPPADPCKDAVCSATGKCGLRNKADGTRCLDGKTCQAGACSGPCVRECTDKACGDDGCGGSCGICLGGRTCDAGKCQCPQESELCYGTCIAAGTTCCAATAEALHEALGPGGPDTIRLCPNTTYQGRFTIERNRKVTLIGAGPGSTTLDGGGERGAVVVVNDSAVVELRGIRITNGHGSASGGGIGNFAGRLTLVDVRVTGNAVDYDGAGIWSNGGTLALIDSEVTDNHCGGEGTAGYGGGIHNYAGAVTLTRSRVSGNSAISGGGIKTIAGVEAVGGTVVLEDGSEVSGNTAAFGGGIQLENGMVTLGSGTKVTHNTAHLGAGIDNKYVNGRVVLAADDIVTDNYLPDGTTESNCYPVNTIPNCIG